MKKIVSSSIMSGIDKSSIDDYSFTADKLMEQAGCSIAREIRKYCLEKKKNSLLIAVGGGNNGGDGLVIARNLYNDFHTIILLAGKGKSETYLKNLEICKRLHIDIIDFIEQSIEVHSIINNSECIADCLTGTGLSSPPKKQLENLIIQLNNSKAPKLSVDMPSGLFEGYNGKTAAINANITYYINFPKLAFFNVEGRKRCGELIEIQIGFPDTLVANAVPKELLLEQNDIADFYSPIKAEDHKYSKGKLAVFAGKIGTSGAAVLASNSAMHSGCGLVSLYTDKEVYAVAAASNPSIMVWPDEYFNENVLEKCEAFCAGPGWGISEKQTKILNILLESGIPGCIDADALDIYAENYSLRDICNLTLTPHPGEFIRMSQKIFNKTPNPGAIREEIKNLSDKLNAVIVYKSHITYIAVPGFPLYVVDGRFPPLGVAGAGDVLAGLIGGFLARKFNPRDAAISGTLIHLSAAKKLFNQNGFFGSDELIPAIGKECSLYEAT